MIDVGNEIQNYDEILKYDPKDSLVYYKRGKAKANLKDYRGAITDFNEALELYHNDIEAYFSRALAKANILDFEGAIRDFNEAINLDPDDAWAYLCRGNAKFSINDFEGALKDLDKAIERDPNCREWYLSRHRIKEKLEDHEGANQDLQKSHSSTYYLSYTDAKVIAWRCKVPLDIVCIVVKDLEFKNPPSGWNYEVYSRVHKVLKLFFGLVNILRLVRFNSPRQLTLV